MYFLLETPGSKVVATKYSTVKEKLTLEERAASHPNHNIELKHDQLNSGYLVFVLSDDETRSSSAYMLMTSSTSCRESSFMSCI